MGAVAGDAGDLTGSRRTSCAEIGIGGILERNLHQIGRGSGTTEEIAAQLAAFADIGWRWGGNWNTLKDWMHFSRSGR